MTQFPALAYRTTRTSSQKWLAERLMLLLCLFFVPNLECNIFRTCRSNSEGQNFIFIAQFVLTVLFVRVVPCCKLTLLRRVHHSGWCILLSTEASSYTFKGLRGFDFDCNIAFPFYNPCTLTRAPQVIVFHES